MKPSVTSAAPDIHDVINMARAAHRAKGNPLSVTPVVVLWGAAHHTLPESAQHDGIDVISGRSLRRWLAELDNEPVSKTAAAELIQRLERCRAAAWDNARG